MVNFIFRLRAWAFLKRARFGTGSLWSSHSHLASARWLGGRL